MGPADSPVIVTVFRSRLRSQAAALGYAELADVMERRARAMPGFVDFKTFSASDGERVSVVVFASIEDHNRWRDDPEHRAAQQRGITEFYAEYEITVGEVLRQHAFRFDGRLSDQG